MEYLGFAFVMLIAQFSPGPDMLLLLKNAVNHPLRAGLWTVLGIVCGLTVHTTLSLTGVAVIFRQSPAAARLLSAAGGLYLLWIAGKLLRSVIHPGTSSPDTVSSGSFRPLSDRAAFLQGLLTNLLNVKAVLFLLSFTAAALPGDSSTERKLIIAAIVLGQALVFWSLFVWLLQRPGIAAHYRRGERPLNVLFCAGLAILAVRALATALSANPGGP
jgi:threonine efflux protein